MSLIPSQRAAVAINTANTVGAVLPSLRNVISQVLDERAANLAFRQAVTDHERDNTSPASATAGVQQVSASGGSRAGGGRGGGSSSMVPTNRSDLRVSPRSDFTVPAKVPRVVSRVVWDIVKVRSTITAGNSSLTETNFSVNLQTHPQYASWQALFDQWCVPQFSVSFFSLVAPGSSTSPVILHSALDFDNTTNLSSIGALDDYGSATVKILSAGQSYTRSVRPCTKPTLSSVGSGGISRTWCDCGGSGATVPWFGIRTMLEQTPAGSQTVVVELTVWYAFRNTI